MRIGIIGSPNGWYWKDLQRAADESDGDIHLVPVAFRSLAARLDNVRHEVYSPGGGDALDALDGVLVRSMPPGSLEQVVFRMDVLHTLLEHGCPVVNEPRALETAIDKYLSLARLRMAGFNVPATIVTQDEAESLAAFDHLGRDVVVKPIFGSEGRGLIRLTDGEIARRVFHSLHQVHAVHYVQQFIPNYGYDLRLLVIGDTVLGIRRICQNDWRANLAQGAHAEPLTVDDALTKHARTAARAIGAHFAAVDLLPGKDGVLYALEVNAVPGWRGLARTLQCDVAALVLASIRQLVTRDSLPERAAAIESANDGRRRSMPMQLVPQFR